MSESSAALPASGADDGRGSRLAVLRRAAAWLVFLAPFFYATYGAANWLASRRADVPSVVYDWERSIPFVPWTILPYWSINLFYSAGLFLNDSRTGVDRLAGRYLTAQIVAVACFVAFPLTATFQRPETVGWPGFMFAVLGGFDKPFNQAPSLHIALLVIIWDHYRRFIPRPALILWHGWCVLIGASVLTTWQHHAVDIPTGALLGLLALWLFPAEGQLPVPARLTRDSRRRVLALRYGLAAAVLLLVCVFGTARIPAFLVLLWPALALSIVAWGYAAAGPVVFQKRHDGSVSLASRLLLWPYRFGAVVNVYLWTRRLPAAVEVAPGLHLGRYPTAAEADAYATVVDLAAEMARPAATHGRWVSIPMLDLVDPEPEDRTAASRAIEEALAAGPVLVCCALGFQRSAGVVADRLVAAGQARNASYALAHLSSLGRPIHARTPVTGAGPGA